MSYLEEFYEVDSKRFWDPCDGPIGRDLHMIDLAYEKEFNSVLDYGPGSGSLLLNILKDKKNCEIIGYDISQNVTNNLRANMDKLIHQNKIHKSNKGYFYTVNNDILSNTQDKSVDLCVCGGVLEHLIDPFQILREFKRVLKDDGRVIISVPNYGYLKHIYKLIRGKQPITGGHASVKEWHKPEEGWDGMHLHTFTYESLDAALLTTGFKVQKIVGDSKKLKIPFIDKIRRKYPSLLCGTITALAAA